MKRLTLKNIQYVKEYIKDGVTYAWFVRLGKTCADCTTYINYKDGRTTADPYPKEWLPVTIQKYLDAHRAELWTEVGEEFRQYIYR